jgi:hypothetical protein
MSSLRNALTSARQGLVERRNEIDRELKIIDKALKDLGESDERVSRSDGRTPGNTGIREWITEQLSTGEKTIKQLKELLAGKYAESTLSSQLSRMKANGQVVSVAGKYSIT